MYPSKDIVDNSVNSADHTTLVAAVKASGLVDTLKSPGPFTVFTPTNEAFAALPAGTVDMLVKPENKATLTSSLTYHVISGRYDFRKFDEAIKAGGERVTRGIQCPCDLGASFRSERIQRKKCGETCVPPRQGLLRGELSIVSDVGGWQSAKQFLNCHPHRQQLFIASHRSIQG